jgi:hypothetical protein
VVHRAQYLRTTRCAVRGGPAAHFRREASRTLSPIVPGFDRGGPLHHLAGIAEQPEQRRVLPAQSSQRFYRRLPDQRIRRRRVVVLREVGRTSGEAFMTGLRALAPKKWQQETELAAICVNGSWASAV